jgi:hypothetical protein
MAASLLISRYRQTVVGVETQSCSCGDHLTGDAWRERGCGISYEYLNDICVRTEIDLAIRSGELSAEQLAVVADLDARLKTLLAANGVSTSGATFWQNGLPLGVAE